MKKNKFYKENKRILQERKTKCCICGEDAKCCLEFHHIKDKLYNISEAASHIPTELFIKELDKCVCICSNCHKKLHNGLLELSDTLYEA
jgi:hypothetical protein